jgi:hypothetical protein
MFRLIATVKRGTADFPQVVPAYATRELARAAGRELMKHERVLRVMMAANDIPPRFVEWLER